MDPTNPSMVFCRGCGHKLHETAPTCPRCGAPQRIAPPPQSNQEALKYVLPIGRSGWAIAAGYLALFSVLVLPAPFALFCGLMGLRDIARNPGKLGKPRAIFGIVMGLAVILGLATLYFTR